MDEIDAGLKPKTRRKIELAIEGGWKFDKETWDASVARHKKHDMKQIFADFDSDGDGKASQQRTRERMTSGASLSIWASSPFTPLVTPVHRLI